MDEIRWGIIGCGDVTEVKSGPAFQKVEHSQLAAVMRRNGDLARDYATRHNVPKWYDDAAALIADPDVNAIYVATPPSSHKEYTLMAARAGKPVYVEKPMARNFKECEEMIIACRNAKVPLFVAYYRRALPRFLKVSELLENGAIGNVRFVTTTLYQPAGDHVQDRTNLPWRVQPEIAGGGLFFDLASHTLDILDFLLGPITSVKGHATNQAGLYEAEDIVSSTYVFESGVHGAGMWCFSAYKYVDLIEIVGTKGKLSFATFGDGPITLDTASGTEQFNIENPIHIQQPLIETIVQSLRGEGTCPSTADSGARTSWVMDEMVREYYRHLS